MYVADSESNGVAPNPGWKRGIRVGEAASGKVRYRIPDPLEAIGCDEAPRPSGLWQHRMQH